MEQTNLQDPTKPTVADTTATSGPPVGKAAPLPSQDVVDRYNRALETQLDQDPTLVGDTVPTASAQDNSPWYKKVLKQAGLVVRHPFIAAATAVQGIEQGARNLVKTGVHLTATALAENPLAPGGAAAGSLIEADPESHLHRFLNWYDSTVDNGIGKFLEWQDNHMWDSPEDAHIAHEPGLQFIKGIGQFSSGMFAAGPIFGAATKGATLLNVAKTLGAGAVSAFAAFDPQEKWLANAVAEGPEWFGKPVGEFLAVQENSSEWANRARHAAEGTIVSLPLEGLSKGMGAIYTALRVRMPSSQALAAAYRIRAQRTIIELRKNTNLTPAERLAGVQAVHADLQVAANVEAKNLGGDHVTTAKTPAGVTVVATPEEVAANQIPADAPRFASEAQGQTVAASTNEMIDAHRAPPGLSVRPLLERRAAAASDEPTFLRRATDQGRKPPPVPSAEPPAGAGNPPPNPELVAQTVIKTVQRMSPELQAEWKAYTDRLATGEDAMKVLADFQRDQKINMNYIEAPQESMASVRALEETLPADITWNGEKIQTHEQTLAFAQEIDSSIPPENWIRFAQQVFGNTERLPQQLVVMRAWVMKLGQKAYELSQVAEANPENGIAHANLANALNSLYALHRSVVGSIANTARALNSQQIVVNPEEFRGAVVPTRIQRVAAKRIETAGNAAQEELNAVRDLLTQAQDASTPTEAAAGDRISTKDTRGVGANDFSLARARKRAEAAIARLQREADTYIHDPAQAEKRSAGILENAQAQAEAPLEVPTPKPTGGTPPPNPIEELSTWIDQAQRQLDAQMARARGELKTAPPHRAPSSFDPTGKGITPFEGLRAADITAGKTKAELRALARMVFMSEGDPAEILAAITTPSSKVPRDVPPLVWKDRVMAFRYEAMLSGPKTQLVNAMSNAIAFLQRPAEYYWAGVPGPRNWSGNPALRQMGADMLGGLWRNMRDSWTIAKKTWRVGENILDPGRTHVGQEIGSQSVREGAWGENGWLHRLFYAPSRSLMTIDEFFQQMNYRGNLRAQILRQARAEGISDPQVLAERLNQQLPLGFNDAGQATNPLALQYSRVGTFKNDLGTYFDAQGNERDTFGKTLQDLTRNSTMARLIMPFVRTPVNLTRYTMERTPLLRQFSHVVAEDLAAGGERAAIARAKLQMGTFLWGSAALLATTGQITGAGPSDPQLRAEWKGLGFQPYSFRIPGTKKWISYKRGDPTFTMLGVVADIVSMYGDLPENERAAAITNVIGAVAASVTNKTFMQGISQTMDGLFSGDGNALERAAEGFAGSFMPNLFNQLNPDAYMRETRSIVDEMLSRVPIGSETLEPHRNLFGQKVLLAPWANEGGGGYLNKAFNPFTLAPGVEPTDVRTEIVALGRALSMPPTKLNGIDLTDRTSFPREGQKPNFRGQFQSPYDRWVELMGQGMEEDLTRLVEDPSWKDLGYGNELNVGGSKYMLLNSIVESHKSAAWAQLLSEYPKLGEALVGNQVRAATGFAPDSLQGIARQFKVPGVNR